ncbi:MAG TPA: phytanoyl-CoA dioxygenase family protein [Stellaceae bacterium]|jgi:hypothetical protein
MGKVLSDGQIAQDERDGFVCPVEAFSREAAPGFRDAQFDQSDNMPSRGQTLTPDFDRSNSVSMALKAGQMSLHHTHLIHRSGPNLSNDQRIGFGISYIPASATCRPSARQSAMLVRGIDRYGHFDDERRPTADFGPDERAYHKAAVARFRVQNAEQFAQYEVAT